MAHDRFWHVASVRTHGLNGRYRMHSEQRSEPALNGSVAFDPERTSFNQKPPLPGQCRRVGSRPKICKMKYPRVFTIADDECRADFFATAATPVRDAGVDYGFNDAE